MLGIEERQRTLNLKDIGIAVVIGLGGVGSWVALDLALSGKVKEMIIIDDDKIESSNLNRTPFRICDIGAYKTEVMHWFCKPSDALRTHHLHLIPFESTLWNERIQFRELLRSDENVTPT